MHKKLNYLFLFILIALEKHNNKMKIYILTPNQMRELSSYGLDTSDASLYINDVTADDIDNGQLLVNLFPNDGSRQHEIEHSHAIFVYSVNDAIRKLPNTNVQITNYNGEYTVNIYSESIYENKKAISDVDYMLAISRDAISLCDSNKPWQLASMNEIVGCLQRLKNNIVTNPNEKPSYRDELIMEAINISRNMHSNFTDNLSIQSLIEKVIYLLKIVRLSYKNIVFNYKSPKYNNVLFECMKYFLSNGKQLKRLS